MKPVNRKSLVVKAVLLLLALLLLPDSARAQWGNQGRNGRSQGSWPNGSQRPTRSYYSDGYPGRPPSDSFEPDLSFIPKIVDGLLTPRPNYEPDYDYDYQPQPRYQPPRNTVKPAAPPRPAAPKNTVVTKKKPALQALKPMSREVSQAETDARQEVEVAESKGTLDAAITAELASAKPQPSKQLRDDWAEAIRNGGSTEDIQAFLEKHGPNGTGEVSGTMLSSMELRQQFSEYGDDLRAGTLTLEGQEERLADLQAAVTAEAGRRPGSSAFFSTLTDNVSSMRDYNTMGQLAEATGGLDNPYPTLVQGAERMGMPVMFVSELTGQPVMSVDPVSDAPSGPAAAVLIYSPSTNSGTVSYLLDTNSYEMAPGTEQKLDRAYRITFDPGVGGGEKAYTLSDGVYEWQHDATSGWNLYKMKVEVTIDNSRYNGDFQYLLNDESKTVKAGEIVEHSSERPLEVAFDGGKGAESRKMLKSGRYVVGVDPDEGQLDLFDAAKVDAAEAQEPKYRSSTLTAGTNATRAERVEALLSQIDAKGSEGARRSTGKVVSPLGNKKPAKSVDELLQSIGGKEEAPAPGAGG